MATVSEDIYTKDNFIANQETKLPTWLESYQHLRSKQCQYMKDIRTLWDTIDETNANSVKPDQGLQTLVEYRTIVEAHSNLPKTKNEMKFVEKPIVPDSRLSWQLKPISRALNLQSSSLEDFSAEDKNTKLKDCKNTHFSAVPLKREHTSVEVFDFNNKPSKSGWVSRYLKVNGSNGNHGSNRNNSSSGNRTGTPLNKKLSRSDAKLNKCVDKPPRTARTAVVTTFNGLEKWDTSLSLKGTTNTPRNCELKFLQSHLQRQQSIPLVDPNKSYDFYLGRPQKSH